MAGVIRKGGGGGGGVARKSEGRKGGLFPLSVPPGCSKAD